MIHASDMVDLPQAAHKPVLQPTPSVAEAAQEPGIRTAVVTDDHRLRTRALAIPGVYYHKGHRAYVIDNPGGREAQAIITLFPEALIAAPWLEEVRDAAYGTHRPHDYATSLDLRLDPGPLGEKSLYPYQDRDGGYLYAIMERDGGAHVGWDRGLGKTLISAAFIKKMSARRTLIVARNDAKEDPWLKELTGALPDHDIIVYPDSTKPARQRQALEVVARYPGEKLVFIIHYQAIRTIAGNKVVEHRDGTVDEYKGRGDGWKALGHWDLMVYDESHRLASYNPNSRKNTQEGRALSALRRHHVDKVVNLSGSAVMNHPDDLFGQLHLLYPERYAAKYADWNDRFVDHVREGMRKHVIGWRLDKLEDLRKELGVFMVYRNKLDVLEDLPPLIHQNIELDMLPEQRRVYEQVRDEYWAMLEGGGIVVKSSMDMLNKLRQVATAWPGVPSAKLDYLVEEINADDEQWGVFTWYKSPGRILAERLGDDAVVVDGDVSQKHRRELRSRHERGQAKVLIGSIATIGESLNLQYMHRGARLDRSYNPQQNGQTVDRLHRNGQVEPVTFLDLWTKDSVDLLRVKPRLSSKEHMRKVLFG